MCSIGCTYFPLFSHLDASCSCGHLCNVVNQAVFEALHKGIGKRPSMKPLETLDCVFAVCDNLWGKKEKKNYVECRNVYKVYHVKVSSVFLFSVIILHSCVVLVIPIAL